MEPILEVKNLVKHFGPPAGGFTAVDDISFSVNRGEIVGLLGPNGAGKTTTLSMILGIIAPTSGDITVFGKNFFHHREEVLQHINYASAYTRAPWRLKVWEHLFVFAKLYQVPKPLEKVREMMDIFQLTKRQDVFAGDLSAGNLARVNLAKAFINDPEMVLLDEPTSSLDPDIADHVRKFILDAQIKWGTTIVITSHNMAEIEELCDRVIFMNHGKIVAEDTPEGLARKIDTSRVQLMMRDGQKRTIAYCKRKNLPIDVKERYVTISIKETEIAKFLNDLAKIGVDYSEISIQKPTLEDFFIGEARHD